MSRKVKFLVLLPLALMLVALKPTPTSAKSPPAKLTIPGYYDLTGPYATSGHYCKLGTDLWHYYLNKYLGGIKGTTEFVVRYYDHKSDPTLGIPIHHQAVSELKPVIVNSMMSNVAEALKPFAEEDKVPIINTSGTKNLQSPPGWIFCQRPDYADELAAFGKYTLGKWKETRKPKFAIFLNDTTWGRASLPAVPLLKEMGIEVVSQDFIPPTPVDITPQLLRIQEANPDYIWVIHGVAGLDVVLRQAKDVGLDAAKMVTGSQTGLAALVQRSGELAEGLSQISPFVPYSSEAPGMVLLNKTIKEFSPKDYPPDTLVTQFFVMSMAITKYVDLTVDRVGWDNLSGEEVYKTIVSGVKIDTKGLTGAWYFDEVLRRGLHQDIMAQVQKGVPVAVSDWIDLPYMLKWK